MPEKSPRPTIASILALIMALVAAVSFTYSATAQSMTGKIETVAAKQNEDESQITDLRISVAQENTKLDSILSLMTDLKLAFREHEAKSSK